MPSSPHFYILLLLPPFPIARVRVSPSCYLCSSPFTFFKIQDSRSSRFLLCMFLFLCVLAICVSRASHPRFHVLTLHILKVRVSRYSCFSLFVFLAVRVFRYSLFSLFVCLTFHTRPACPDPWICAANGFGSDTTTNSEDQSASTGLDGAFAAFVSHCKIDMLFAT